MVLRKRFRRGRTYISYCSPHDPYLRIDPQGIIQPAQLEAPTCLQTLQHSPQFLIPEQFLCPPGGDRMDFCHIFTNQKSQKEEKPALPRGFQVLGSLPLPSVSECLLLKLPLCYTALSQSSVASGRCGSAYPIGETGGAKTGGGSQTWVTEMEESRLQYVNVSGRRTGCERG
ncbi:hypothetical protein JZ751_008025 [Albula glossodonta]|uniref:Uncharacterized protein n=1 Tax=Albula glossodonta TaxID=121402 RepID=A0A8T2P9A5_9TELE|nr:hypothetical protein JZ751_008025 [Albula glossodonta]